MKVKKIDRRIRRSKTLIKETYLNLIKNTGSTTFSITEIIQQCDLNRSTFYAHFRTKDELTDTIIEDLLTGLKEEISTAMTKSKQSIFHFELQLVILKFIETHALYFHTLFQYFSHFTNELTMLFYELIMEEICPLPMDKNIMAIYFSSSIVGVIYYWIVEIDCKFSTDFMAKQLTHLFDSSVQLKLEATPIPNKTY